MKLFEFIYTKHRKIEFQPISVVSFMQEVTESVTPILAQKNQTIVCTTVEARIEGDSNLLKSAFINIIDNARKASEQGSEIWFFAKQTDDGVQIGVQDFGVGISEEHLQRIFDEFYMVDKSRSRKEGGAGLGLSLAASIVESHGEKLEIESTVGEGTTMWVVFHEINLTEQLNTRRTFICLLCADRRAKHRSTEISACTDAYGTDESRRGGTGGILSGSGNDDVTQYILKSLGCRSDQADLRHMGQ